MQNPFVLNHFFSIFASSTNSKYVGVQKPVKPFWQWFSITLFVCNSLLFVSFLSGVNSYASTGYEIRKLQDRLVQLSEENKKLNLQAAKNSSVTAIESEFLNINYIAAGTPRFLESSLAGTALHFEQVSND